MTTKPAPEPTYDVIHTFDGSVHLPKCSRAEAVAFKKARKGDGYDVKIVKHTPPLPFSISCDWEDD